MIEQNIFFPKTCVAYTISKLKFTVWPGQSNHILLHRMAKMKKLSAAELETNIVFDEITSIIKLIMTI